MNRNAAAPLEGAADLHFHLLPGVDDGPETLEESLFLARLAAEQGTRTIVATPHVRTGFLTDVSELGDRVRQISSAIRKVGIPVEVRCGAELGDDMVGLLGQAELESVAHGPPGARWLLVEAPFGGMAFGFHEATDELRDRGFSVLIAHPERTADAEVDGAAGLRRELSRGALAQLNAQSLTGEHGASAEHCAHDLLREGLVHIVASDAHGPTRPPMLASARERLRSAGVGSERARSMTQATPRRLLARGIPAAEPVAA